MTQEVQKWLTEFLEEENFFKYHAYYRNVRHNHAAHGAVAIARLGGTKEHVQHFYDVITKTMVRYDPNEELTEKHEVDFIKSDNLLDYRGKSQAYYKMFHAYNELFKNKYGGDIKRMIGEECKDIIDGPSVSAFHGIIQMAYGYAGNNDLAMLEGLVFMDQEYSTMCMGDIDNPKRTDLSRFGQGETDMLDILTKLHENKDLQQQISKEDRISGGLKLFSAGPMFHGEYFLDLTDDVKLPDGFDPSSKDPKQLELLINWLIDMASLIYVSSATINDFFLLHGVTGGWSYKMILPLLDYDTALFGIRGFLAALLSVYTTRGAPALENKPEVYYNKKPTQEVWDEFITSLLNDKDYETHVYKVIQVLYEQWKERPDSPYAQYCIAGAFLARNNNYGVPGVPGGVFIRNDDVTQ